MQLHFSFVWNLLYIYLNPNLTGYHQENYGLEGDHRLVWLHALLPETPENILLIYFNIVWSWSYSTL